MKYFYDTEFIEDGKTIDLISIGIVAEDGRTYYAISNEFDATKANSWVTENVLSKLETDPVLYKSRKQIKEDLLVFIGHENDIVAFPEDGKPEFWAYYADYDHVVLCQLFGTMMNLPKGWPMYTRDVKQLCDSLDNPRLPEQIVGEHNALDDAKWNKTVYEFLINLGYKNSSNVV